ncbi:hypothetical protein KU735_22825, partial [Salmonella enterica subsp. enterica serovar Give]|nr:hypothetical protein [Salmonella enterica subsp. enterica serovar Give]
RTTFSNGELNLSGIVTQNRGDIAKRANQQQAVIRIVLRAGDGQYRVLTYNTSLLATGSYTSLDVDVHQTSAGIISGPTISTGN